MMYAVHRFYVQPAILLIKGNRESLTFSDNLFINNSLSCIIMGGNSDNILVQGNIFHGNQPNIHHTIANKPTCIYSINIDQLDENYL